ncbi:hypothetical protein P167DRAFT_578411 [Morchella conica CCBAS932]|uniref:Uncharacterized protein n=1 Tax=Morchella conica CCBAS932 TaxID=1392247 RepID=A0A3N4KG56_9PEZI|nr:hypothetical protein P167DRAFT_578411 [Morchella conica CCBAS932]
MTTPAASTPKPAPPQKTSPLLLWAHPVPKIPLFLALTAHSLLLPALHCFRLCHQYGTSTHHTSTLLPPISRLPLSVSALIEHYLFVAVRRSVQDSWDAGLKSQGMCMRCRAPVPQGGLSREEALRRRVCKCRAKLLASVEEEIGKRLMSGRNLWGGEGSSGGDGAKLGMGSFLKRFWGLAAFVEGVGTGVKEKVWLVLPVGVKNGGGGGVVAGGEGGKGPWCVGRGYAQMDVARVRRFRWAIGMMGVDVGQVGGEKCLVHLGEMGEEEVVEPEDGVVEEGGVRLMLFTEGVMAP